VSTRVKKKSRRKRTLVHLRADQVSMGPRSSLRHVVEYAKRRYGGHPNVVGIAIGHKFVGGISSDILSIQFFVRRKRRKRILRPLPRFLCARLHERANRSRRYPTDVIEVGRIQFSCGAGSSLDALGSRGSASLLFQDKEPSGARRWYVLTCSHVIGNLTMSPPVDGDVAIPDCTPTAPFALVEKNTTAKVQTLAYDLAIASLTAEAIDALQPHLRELDCRVEGGRRLSDFIAEASIRPGLHVECQLGTSGQLSGTVQSFGASFPIIFRGREYEVGHLYTMNGRVLPGDSGGLLYSEDLAVGVMVAQASNTAWAWFQPLEAALDYLNATDPVSSFTCF